eukprot:COSAG03_NODE_4877_length_1407_cov_0.988532_1_plen_79_part_00
MDGRGLAERIVEDVETVPVVWPTAAVHSTNGTPAACAASRRAVVASLPAHATVPYKLCSWSAAVLVTAAQPRHLFMRS